MSAGVLESIPDAPRWVETRSMLLRGCAELFGLRQDSASWHFAALDRAIRLLSIVGTPDNGSIQAAAAALEGKGAILTPADYPLLLGQWTRQTAILYERTSDPPFPVIPGATSAFLAAGDLPGSLPQNLREELVHASTFSPISATFVGGQPVSFCYGVATETLWDVSIDTLEAHRGRGYAQPCLALMIEHMAARGKRPVWGAMHSNIASRRLAAKVGFTPVDGISVYEPACSA